MEFFGGKESYEKGVERDKRKKELFKKNKCHLIEVRKGYKIEDVIKKIRDLTGYNEK